MRICSLLPSATDIVYALGLGSDLVAVTHECDVPAGAAPVPVVTRSVVDAAWSSRRIHDHVTAAAHEGSSLYAIDHELLARLDPELVLTQELCDVCAVSYAQVAGAVHRLDVRGGRGRTILSLTPRRLADILESIEQVGDVAGVAERARALTATLRGRIARVADAAARAAERPRVFAMEWLDPAYGAGHWVPEMIRLAGGRDGLGREGAESVQLAWRAIAAYDPEIVVLMPCSFSLERTLAELPSLRFPPEWARLTAVAGGRVYAVDAVRYFSRSGPRSADGLQILAEIIHPELFPRETPADAWTALPAAAPTGR